MSNAILIRSYRIINIVFICIILSIFGYSYISGVKEVYPVPSGSNFFSGQYTLSTGLSHSFSAIVRFKFSLAKDYNPYGLRVFLFFLFQLLFRITFLHYGSKPKYINTLLFIDITISTTVFIFAFWPFIKEWTGLLI